jgi:hypothetical protein
MIHNKVLETFNSLAIGWLLSGVCWSPTFFKRQVDLIKILISKAAQAGNQAYDLFKAFDGIASGIIMRDHDHFINALPTEDLVKTLVSNNDMASAEWKQLDRIFKGPSQESIELSGMQSCLDTLIRARGSDKIETNSYESKPSITDKRV